MRPKIVLVASPSKTERTVVLTGAGQHSIRFIGSSAPTTVPPGARIHSFGVCQDEASEIDVLAVSIWTGDPKQGQQWTDFMLRAAKEDGKCVIDLEDPWIPMNGRLGQVVGDHMEVFLGGEWFTTDSAFANKGTGRYLPGPNKVCAYLAGKIEEKELLEQAEAAQAEVTVREQLAAARDELVMLRGDYAELERICERLRNEKAQLVQHLHDTRADQQA